MEILLLLLNMFWRENFKSVKYLKQNGLNKFFLFSKNVIVLWAILG